jgi:predicted transcriptional regulator
MVNKTEYYLPMEMQPIFKMLTDSDAVEMRSLYTAAARGGIDVSRVDSMLRTLFGHGIIEFVACEKL